MYTYSTLTHVLYNVYAYIQRQKETAQTFSWCLKAKQDNKFIQSNNASTVFSRLNNITETVSMCVTESEREREREKEMYY